METIECKYCDTKISYKTSANFIIFCPNCKRNIYLECEYGYGPVTPCNILLGNEKIGTVNVDENNKYFLEYRFEKIKLNKGYLDALWEAIEIVKKKISPN
ncbi:hypothetical protein R2R35_14680 [Anaerocolumna sp. AGMB13020]|uniref:hypothetical protein n=1 Tax=Anaerocolumna sp. AGMB13020 TaxID=3081750 RepID=UPI002952AF70|nr:hypothetical protein [Anaerocolumna sp. AGMB13020]WOO35043.1 hypothetical protein R2R35_14680 [Anaerocolumna sp. AGMB13020]